MSPTSTASTPRGVPAADEDAFLRELIERSERTGTWWPQFRSLAGARQYRTLHELVRRWVPPGARALDWGTGNGHFALFLRRHGCHVTGFSLEPQSLAGWLGEPYDRYVQGDPGEPVRLPFEEGSFDAVGSVGVLEHVRETGGSEAGSLAEIARVLRPGGVFVCVHFPNHGSWIDWMARRSPGKHVHDFRYRRSDIVRLVHDAGLELLQVQRYGCLPRNVLARLPAGLRHARALADAWDGLDAALGAALGPICQNWAFAARRPR